MTKQELIQQIQDLPEEVSLDRIASEVERVRFMASVNRGLRQAERGQGSSHEDFMARFQRRFER